MERHMLTNLMEYIAIKKYDEIKGSLEVCQCERCRLDILSYVLNRMPPRYVVTEKGEALAKIESMSFQFESDVVTHLVNASMVVHNHPRHQA